MTPRGNVTSSLSALDLELLRLLNRWSDPMAVKAASGDNHAPPKPWKIQPNHDLNWFHQQVLSMPEAETVDVVGVLRAWDNYLETLARVDSLRRVRNGLGMLSRNTAETNYCQRTP